MPKESLRQGSVAIIKYRGVTTCTHVRTCVPEKVEKKKKIDLGLEGGGGGGRESVSKLIVRTSEKVLAMPLK